MKNHNIINEYLEYDNIHSKNYKKYLVLLTVGSFYEVYSIIPDDNKLKEISELLNLVLTRKNKSIVKVSKSNPLMMGFPCISLNKYLDILVNNNYTVIEYIQYTDKTKIKRKLNKIYSIGTYLENDKSIINDNLILSLYIEEINNNILYGISIINLSTGKINLFDRSWYNRGLVEPVAGYGTPEEYEDFMENVENFENSLVENGDFLFKLWFSIDKETMAKRFKQRLSSPLKKWKYSPNDEKMLDLWDRFTEFKEKLFDRTSTVNHPWVILDALDKKISGLNAIRYVLQNIPYDNKNNDLLDRNYPEALTVLKP